MNFPRFFVDKPIFAAVLSIIIFVAGLISIFLLPVSEYPDVVPPSVVVRAQYPGADPKVIAETVAAPLEEQINGVDNMLYMTSQNTADGSLMLTVSFKIGTNVSRAETDVQNRETAVQSRETASSGSRQSAPAPVQSSQPAAPAPAPAVSYANCTAARDAGAAPVRSGDPGYGRHLDRDGDGIGCE